MIFYEYKIASVHSDSSKFERVLDLLESEKWRVLRCSALNGRVNALLERTRTSNEDK